LAAINCCNKSEKGYKLFRFPMGDRRTKWVLNVWPGNNWTSTEASRLCEKHFENSQFESHRSDDWKKLKPNAIPTLFDVLNPPEDELSRLRLENEKLLRQLQTHELLVIENQKLRDQINAMEKVRQSFLNDNQIKMLEQGQIFHWPNDSIVKALNSDSPSQFTVINISEIPDIHCLHTVCDEYKTLP
ncbi:THAP4 protein, partial [Acromyrmex charruanus]